MAKKYYAYIVEGTDKQGIVDSWDICKGIVSGVKARYKSFPSELEAADWLNSGAEYSVKQKEEKNTKILPGIYFDAGKRGKNGIAFSRITNEKSEDLIELLADSSRVIHGDYIYQAIGFAKARHEIDNYYGSQGINLTNINTNNVGELLAFIAACEIALKREQKGVTIYGDSKLVLDYWSKGVYKATLPDSTKQIIQIAARIRKMVEKTLDVKIKHISGDVNPSDLGFHK